MALNGWTPGRDSEMPLLVDSHQAPRPTHVGFGGAGNDSGGIHDAFPGFSQRTAGAPGATPVWPVHNLNGGPSPPDQHLSPLDLFQTPGWGRQTPDWGATSDSWQGPPAGSWGGGMPGTPHPRQGRAVTPNNGFFSTAWQPPEVTSPSQPVGDGWFGAGSRTAKSPFSIPITPSKSFGDGWGNIDNEPPPASATLPMPQSPSTEDGYRMKRSLTWGPAVGKKKFKSRKWYPHGDIDEWNPAQRPRDWRADFEMRPSFIKLSLSKNRSDVQESNDPERRILHGLLAYDAHAPSIHLDLRTNPFTQPAMFSHLGRAYNQIDLMQIATNPPAPFMRLYHARYPWYVDVYASNPNGVTIYDILMQLHVQMMMAIESRHYYCEDVRSKERELLGAAYTSRCHGDKEIMSRGVVRVDFLGMEGRLLLQGLVRGRNGMWEMKIAKIDS
ncbi:hypothetical protein IW262DRAFT_1395240 [Armillaria fumosa]|nr:hypothetical protein IW262DRAFT_1395240 [Armillaria fumosa]